SALTWLRAQKFVKPDQVAVAGNSFGGIEAVLGAEHDSYCAAIDSAGGAQSWAQAPELQSLMTRSVRNSRAPIFFFQAENDYDLSPSRVRAQDLPSLWDVRARWPHFRLLWNLSLGRRLVSILEQTLPLISSSRSRVIA